MTKAHKITYKVFMFERVKKKIKFFDTETYPLQIRLTAGVRTLYMKSYLFSMLQQKKYQQELLLNADKKISINDVILSEEELMQYVLEKKSNSLSLDAIREAYGLFSYDILQQMDEQFKAFLIDFFYAENLPAYALFIKNDGSNHTSEFILKNLEMSLQAAVFDKLLRAAVVKAPPYIPLIRFFREEIKTRLPVFPVYRWKQETVLNRFTDFINQKFPEYSNSNPADYINKNCGRLLETI